MFQHLSANYSFFNCLHTFSKLCLFFFKTLHSNPRIAHTNCLTSLAKLSTASKISQTHLKSKHVSYVANTYILLDISYKHSYSKPKVLLALQFFSTAYTQNIYLPHNFCNLTLKHQIHTQNHTLIIGLRDQVFNVIKHFLLNTTHNSLCNTQKSNRKCPFSNTTNQNTTLIHQCLTLTPHMCKHSLLYLTPINHGFRIVL